jgi:hypothetical protein
MSWLGSLWRRVRDRDGQRGPRVLRFDAPDHRGEHIALVRSLTEMAGVRLDEIRCEERDRTTALTLVRGRRKRTVVYLEHALDLDRLLAAIESLLPEGREYWVIDREKLGYEHAIAYADASELQRLRELGWQVQKDELSAVAMGVHSADGFRVRGPAERWDDGSLKRILLDEESEVQGVRCAAGTIVRFSPGGVLGDATLATAFEQGAHTLPKGTRVYFHVRSKIVGLAKLPHALEIDGIVLPSGSELEFDDRGALTAAVLSERTALPSGYRDLGSLPEQSVIAHRDGRFDLHAPGHTRTTEYLARPQREAKRARVAWRGWAVFGAVLLAPLALLMGIAWGKSREVGARCGEHNHCHNVLGDRCHRGVCSPSCESTDDCPAGWTCRNPRSPVLWLSAEREPIEPPVCVAPAHVLSFDD